MWSLADIYSITPLLNSLFFEWKNYDVQSSNIIIDPKNECIRIELKHYSLIGHHQYTGLITHKNNKLSFDEFLKILCQVIGNAPITPFITRVKQSRDSIDEAIKSNHNHLLDIKLNFKHTETSLFVGHSLHPTPKSRNEFSNSDLKKFSPEHGAEFRLGWFKIHESIYLENHSSHFEDFDWRQSLTKFKGNNEFKLLPVHPWQKKKILELNSIQEYVKTGLIIDLGDDPRHWTPTSSLRTVYNSTAKYMLKFSMSLKMTNSIRHLLIHELERGLQIDDFSKHNYLIPFFNEYKNFKIIQEPLYAGVIDKNQMPITETLIMIRENPFKEDDEVSLIATLTQPPLENSKPILLSLIQRSQLSPIKWFHSFLTEAIAPLLVAQGRYGLLLGAHQQNLILKFNNGVPVGSYFRDCHGTGYDAEKINSIRGEIPRITNDNGNILDQENANYLFAYYVIINSVFNMITAISYQANSREEDLLRVYRKFLIKLKQSTDLDPQFINYLLHSPELKHKGNFFCTINNINENTESNPLDIYVSIQNPIKEYVDV